MYQYTAADNERWWPELRAQQAREAARREPSAAAVRSSVERGDSFAYTRDAPVGRRVDTGKGVRTALAAALAATANEPVADDSHGPDLQLGVVEAETDGQDADAVEHTRQSRLQRWQRLPAVL